MWSTLWTGIGAVDQSVLVSCRSSSVKYASHDATLLAVYHSAHCTTVSMTAIHLGRVCDSDSLIQRRPPLQSSHCYCCASHVASEGVKSEAFLNG